MRDFHLSDKFLEEFKGKQPDWGYGIFSYITYKRTYARTKEDGTTEEFWETLKRVIEGVFSVQKEHCDALNLTWDSRRAQKSAQIMYRKMWDFKFLPPGRGLWAMGTDAVKIKGSAILNNCAFASTEEIQHDFAAPFCWTLDMLCLGVGVGFDTLGANQIEIKKPTKNSGLKYTIPDTREGWIESLRLVLQAFERGSEIPDFDYSLIRPMGTPIKTFGGVSSGPEPLMKLLNSVKEHLLSKVGERITSVDIVDIMNFIGRCAVAGNVRRSAELALGLPDDEDFVECKNPEKFSAELYDRRWASNNSIAASEGMDYSRFAAMTAKNGEPGYIWLDNTRKYGRMKDEPNYLDANVKGFNPCSEQPLENYELCNLVEVFPAHHDTVEEFYDTLKYAYLYAKTVTLIPTHDARTNAVMLRNRRIGTSLSGIEQAKKKFGTNKFYKDFCDKGYDVVKSWDKVYSNWLCIPRSIKITTVKPSGTVSLLAGATPGMHATHSEFYFRTIRLAHNSPLIKPLLKAGYRIEYGATEFKEHFELSEEIGWSKEKLKKEWTKFVDMHKLTLKNPPITNFEGTLVAYFPIKETNFTKSKDEQTIWEQVSNAAKMQKYWSDNGVSCTVTFKSAEQKDVKTVLEHFEDQLKAISFLPLSEHGYVQAPYITIDENTFNEASKGLKEISLLETSNVDKKEDKYCDGDKCVV